MSAQPNNPHPSQPTDAFKRASEDAFKKAGDKPTKDGHDAMNSLKNTRADSSKNATNDGVKLFGDKATKEGHDAVAALQTKTADAVNTATKNFAADAARQSQSQHANTKTADTMSHAMSNGREAIDKMRDRTAEVAKKLSDETLGSVKEAMQHVATVSVSSGKLISDQLMHNTMENTHAFLEAFDAMFRAKSLTDVVHIQSSFMQSQMSTVAKQVEALFELSSKTTRTAIKTIDRTTTGERSHAH